MISKHFIIFFHDAWCHTFWIWITISQFWFAADHSFYQHLATTSSPNQCSFRLDRKIPTLSRHQECSISGCAQPALLRALPPDVIHCHIMLAIFDRDTPGGWLKLDVTTMTSHLIECCSLALHTNFKQGLRTSWMPCWSKVLGYMYRNFFELFLP